jgi:hypothetical protein
MNGIVGALLVSADGLNRCTPIDHACEMLNVMPTLICLWLGACYHSMLSTRTDLGARGVAAQFSVHGCTESDAVIVDEHFALERHLFIVAIIYTQKGSGRVLVDRGERAWI